MNWRVERRMQGISLFLSLLNFSFLFLSRVDVVVVVVVSNRTPEMVTV